MKKYYVDYENLLKFTKKILNKVGLNKFSYEAVSFGLCEASLRGVDSHGIRLLDHYIKSSLSKRKNATPNFKVYKKYPSILTLDADNAFGLAAGFKAIDIGIKTAKKQGMCAISVKNSSHAASMASMALRAARKNYICLAFTNADSLMNSYNGLENLFGTNPICFAAPRLDKTPFCLDMATTNVSWNHILELRANNKKINGNFAVDKKGKITYDPNKAVGLTPIGLYKGFGLAAMVDVLCGLYNGTNLSHELPPMFTSSYKKIRKVSQFYILLKIDGSISSNFFKKRMQELTNKIRRQKPLKNKKVMAPNDPQINFEKERLKKGIPLQENIYKMLKKYEIKYNCKLNEKN